MRYTQRLTPTSLHRHGNSILCIVTLICMACFPVSANQRLAVTGDRVNLRAAPDPTAEVVGQVSKTDTLILQGNMTDAWIQVTPPDSINLWIYASLVKNNTITVNNAQVRAGAGLNFNVVGKLQRGDTVIKRGQVGDWIKIAPFPSASVWVTNAYVKLKQDSKTQTVLRTKPRSAPAPKPVRIAPTPPPEAQAHTSTLIHNTQQTPSLNTSHTTTKPGTSSHPPKRTLLDTTPETTIGPAKIPTSRLRSTAGQAASGAYSGTLTRVPHGNHPTRYRLVSFGANNKPQTICYVLGNRRQLDALKNSVFTIEGAVYWFNGTERPTVFAQNILRHKTP